MKELSHTVAKGTRNGWKSSRHRSKETKTVMVMNQNEEAPGDPTMNIRVKSDRRPSSVRLVPNKRSSRDPHDASEPVAKRQTPLHVCTAECNHSTESDAELYTAAFAAKIIARDKNVFQNIGCFTLSLAGHAHLVKR